MTPLDKPLKRQIQVKDAIYTVTLDGSGLKITEKGRRNGVELRWEDLVSGDAALASALSASTQS
jgi:hypothetical protein